jgi:hypothetical protein
MLKKQFKPLHHTHGMSKVDMIIYSQYFQIFINVIQGHLQHIFVKY